MPHKEHKAAKQNGLMDTHKPAPERPIAAKKYVGPVTFQVLTIKYFNGRIHQ
jgi:hypothetical protein